MHRLANSIYFFAVTVLATYIQEEVSCPMREFPRLSSSWRTYNFIWLLNTNIQEEYQIHLYQQTPDNSWVSSSRFTIGTPTKLSTFLPIVFVLLIFWYRLFCYWCFRCNKNQRENNSRIKIVVWVGDLFSAIELEISIVSCDTRRKMISKDVTFQVLAAIEGVIVALFIFSYLYRAYALNKMATQRNQIIKPAFKIKVCVLAMVSLVDLIEFILSYADPSFWLYRTNTKSVLLLFQCFVNFIQVVVMHLQNKKCQTASCTHKLYWFTQIILTVFSLAAIFFYGLAYSGVLLPFLKLILFIYILVYSIFYEETPLIHEVPLITQQQHDSLSTRETEMVNIQKAIYVEVRPVPQIHKVGEEINYQFTIAVHVYLESLKIIKRFEAEFEQLRQKLSKIQQRDEEFAFNELPTTACMSRVDYGKRKAKLYEDYLHYLTKDPNRFTEPLLEFLSIEGQIKQKLLSMNRRGKLIEDHPSFNDLDQSYIKGKEKFFGQVEYKNSNIKISNKQGISFEDIKTIEEVQEFHKLLLKKNIIKKQALFSNSVKDCRQFIDNGVNSPKFWMTFAGWMNINRKSISEIYQMLNLYYQGFEESSIRVLGYELFAKKVGETVTMYNFEFRPRKGSLNTVKFKKRFNDFVSLHQQVIKFYKLKRCPRQLPTLPPKGPSIMSNTSPKSRQKLLQGYLQQLMKVEDINYCYPFLLFLQASNPEEGIVIYAPKLQQNNGHISNISSSIPGSSLEIGELDKIAINKII